MSDSNTSKSLHGSFARMSLNELINLLKEKNYITEYLAPVKTGYRNINTEQFYFQFLIKFSDDEKWIVHSTTSIRTDRINIQQWNAYHIKKIEGEVTKSIIVYPDDISDSERDKAVSYYNRIMNKQIYSAINDVVSQSEFYTMVEEKYLRGKVIGQQKALQGINFEEQIEMILNNLDNFTKWSGKNGLETGLFYPYFKQIMDGIGIINPNIVKRLNATRDVGLLPSGGNPKTDVLLKVAFVNRTVNNYTFSLKRTSSDWVSVHEYPIDKFINVLEITDKKLIHTLELFQEVGGMKALGKELTQYLEKEMPQYNRRLSLWVYGGVGGDGNPETQWADYIITYQNETSEFKIHKLEEYIEDILKIDDGHFGTPFRWTYPSGGKGKRIQLKGKIR